MLTIETIQERNPRATAARRVAADRVMSDLQIYARQKGGRFIIYGSVARRIMRRDSDINTLVNFPVRRPLLPAALWKTCALPRIFLLIFPRCCGAALHFSPA